MMSDFIKFRNHSIDRIEKLFFVILFMNSSRLFLKIARDQKMKKIDSVLRISMFQLSSTINILIDFFVVEIFRSYLFSIIKKKRNFELRQRKNHFTMKKFFMIF